MDYITIQDLKLLDWLDHGIYNISGDGWIIQRNLITGGDGGASPDDDYGILVEADSGDATNIVGILVRDNEVGPQGSEADEDTRCAYTSPVSALQYAVTLRGVSHSTIEHNYVHGIFGRGILAVWQDDTLQEDVDAVHILNNRVTDTVGGLFFQHTVNSRIDGNMVYDGCGLGISIISDSSDNVISNNYIDNLKQAGTQFLGTWNGIDLNDNADNNIIENNRISRVVDCLITIEATGGADSDDNIIRYNHLDARSFGVVGGGDETDYDTNYNNDSWVDRSTPLCVLAVVSETADTLGTITQGNTFVMGNNGSDTEIIARTKHAGPTNVLYTLDEWRNLSPTELGLGGVQGRILQSHADDCTALTNGMERDTCYQKDTDTLYVCEPSAAGALCDTAAEWRSTFDPDGIALNLATTGTITGNINVVLDATTSDSPTGADLRGSMLIYSNAGVVTITLPDVDTVALGASACFYDSDATAILTIDLDGDDIFLLDDTLLDAGDTINSPGDLGDFICIVAIDADTTWATMGRRGTWLDDGPL
jgi:hypothetical protein